MTKQPAFICPACPGAELLTVHGPGRGPRYPLSCPSCGWQGTWAAWQGYEGRVPLSASSWVLPEGQP